MSPPHFVLDALKDSITSGTFIDTKFYVFSRRESSGRVGSPRALYCNGHVLSTIPYFSTLFSEGFSEGRTRDLNEGFPSDSDPYTGSYEYLSDSDLENDGDDGEPEPAGDRDSDNESENSSVMTGKVPGYMASFEPAKPIYQLADKYRLLSLKEKAMAFIYGSSIPDEDKNEHEGDTAAGGPPSPDKAEKLPNSQDSSSLNRPTFPANFRHEPVGSSAWMGKVAIISDMAAVTFEAMIYFLYTGQIRFASVGPGPRHELPAEERAGDRNTSRLPSPSAKSIYRLADKYDIPTLKAQAKAHIYDDLVHRNIVDEIFSSFSLSFPEIQKAHVSRLLSKIEDESKSSIESTTRRQLVEKMKILSPSRLARAADILSMIWNGAIGPLEPLAPELHPSFSVDVPLSLNWSRVKLALLKSISTGTFIDVQFYAYNAIDNGLPLDPKPLFASSIVIEEWGPAIMMQAMGENSQATHLIDGLPDDYECWNGGNLPETSDKDQSALKYQAGITTATTKAREPAIVVLGAWKTWMSLLSYAYTDGITFAPLRTQAHGSDPVMDIKSQPSCSPRSMYSLAAALGIDNIKEEALKDIQFKLTTSNIAQELFTFFAANHPEVMDMEIEFLRRNLTEQNPESFLNHIQRLVPEESQFVPETLSLVFSKLLERAFPQPTPLDLDSNSSVISSSGPQVPAPVPKSVPERSTFLVVLLKCPRCGERAPLKALHDGRYCPRCPPGGIWKGRPCMYCPLCNTTRETRLDYCLEKACQAGFIQ